MLQFLLRLPGHDVAVYVRNVNGTVDAISNNHNNDVANRLVKRQNTQLNDVLEGVECVEVQMQQLPPSQQTVKPTSSPLKVLLPLGAKTFTPDLPVSILDTLAQLPGADSEPLLECRIDVHTSDGLRFGEGCIRTIKGLWDTTNPASCSVPLAQWA